MSTSTKEESAELWQFREQWKEEVRRRREVEHHQATSPEPLNQHKASSSEIHARSHPSPRATPPATWSVPGTSHQPLHALHGQSPLSGTIARAVEIYRSAVQHEQKSDLDEALRLYRQAFRLNPDVDRAYFKEEQRLQQLSRSSAGMGHKETTSGSKGEGTEERDSHITRTAESKELGYANKVLPKVLEDFPEVLAFEPEDEREGVPINMIPEELLLCILRNLDATNLERFATVSRKARVLSLDPSIWRYGYRRLPFTDVTISNNRDFVYMTYKPPQIPEAAAVQTIVDEYGSNYRQTYIQHPRVRLDGVYIAVCHYV